MSTPASTSQYAALFPHLQYITLPTGHVVSAAGFGGYRISIDIPEHYQALQYALQNGINLIDTSTNYADGKSEELIGKVLADPATGINPEQIFIVTKIGYVQGSNYQAALSRQSQGKPYPDMCTIQEGLWHCIHPDFLADQLQASLERLALNKVDAVLLHNPEYFLSWKDGHKDIAAGQIKKEFYRRIEIAFEFLEKAVEQGKIGMYGISSNTFPAASDSSESCSLEECLSIASKISKNHHFRIIQFPFNLVEPGAATELNQDGDSQTLIEYAEQNGLIALVNRPLNGIRNGQIIRLADTSGMNIPDEAAIQSMIYTLAAESDHFARNIDALPYSIEDKQHMIDFITTAGALQHTWNKFDSAEAWIQHQHTILGQMAAALSALNLIGDASVVEWTQNFAVLAARITNSVTSWYQYNTSEIVRRNQYIRSAIVKAFGHAFDTQTLSQSSINAVRSVRGISCVLVGCRSIPYVQDVLGALKVEVPEFDRADWLGMILH
jgi:aryl-alcohol dehydrogenase-like predicted oxidoreductase